MTSMADNRIPTNQVPSSQLCKMGQETTQDIVSKTQEVFQLLKVMQPPIGNQTSINVMEDRKQKLNDCLRVIGDLFRKLRHVYDRCCEACDLNEYIQVESLIPLKDEYSNKHQHEDLKNTEQVKRLEEERKLYTDQLKLRTRQLKETIDRLREIVWEINTMLAMRKP